MDILKQLAEELHLEPRRVESVVALLDDGNTIPFIARYRKEQTGAMDDQVLRSLSERLGLSAPLTGAEGKNPRLFGRTGGAQRGAVGIPGPGGDPGGAGRSVSSLPAKRRTRASQAKERGLQPLADALYAQPASGPAPEALAAAYPESGKGGGVGGSRPSGSPGYFGGADCGRPRRPGKAAGLFGRLR